MTDPPAELGRLEKTYARSREQRRRVAWISFGSALVGALVLWAAFAGTEPVSHTIGLSMVAAFLALPAVFGVRELWRGRGTSIELHERGFVFRRAGRESFAAWDDIASYTEHTAVRVEKKNGEVVEFGAAIEGYEELGGRIEDETLARLLPPVVARVRSGSGVRFPGLGAGDGWIAGVVDRALLSPDGFSVDATGITQVSTHELIPWVAIESFGVAEGQEKPWLGFFFFFIEGNQKTFRVLCGALPNAHVLVALCAEMAPAARRS